MERPRREAYAMPEEYIQLVQLLKETGIPFVEYEWEPAPKGTYGVVSLEIEANALNGDDHKQERAYEGSIDLFFKKLSERNLITIIENVLTTVCQASWQAERLQHEYKTGYYHQEWIFQV